MLSQLQIDHDFQQVFFFIASHTILVLVDNTLHKLLNYLQNNENHIDPEGKSDCHKEKMLTL